MPVASLPGTPCYRRARRDGLETAPQPACAPRTVGCGDEVADLAGHAVRALERTIAKNDPGGDTRPDRDVREAPTRIAVSVQPQRRGSRVMLDDRARREALRHVRADGDVAAAEVDRKVDGAGSTIDAARSRDADDVEIGGRRTGLGEGLLDQLDDLLGQAVRGGHRLAPGEDTVLVVDEDRRRLRPADVDARDEVTPPRAVRRPGDVEDSGGHRTRLSPSSRVISSADAPSTTTSSRDRPNTTSVSRPSSGRLRSRVSWRAASSQRSPKAVAAPTTTIRRTFNAPTSAARARPTWRAASRTTSSASGSPARKA